MSAAEHLHAVPQNLGEVVDYIEKWGQGLISDYRLTRVLRY